MPKTVKKEEVQENQQNTKKETPRRIPTEIQLPITSYDNILQDFDVQVTRIAKIEGQKLIKIWGVVTGDILEARRSKDKVKKALEDTHPGYTAEVYINSFSGIYKSRNWN